MELRVQMADALAELDWKPTKDDAEILRESFKSGGQAAFDRLASRLKPAPAAAEKSPEAKPSGTYASPGAPSGAPADVLERDASKWSRDHVERLKADGTFLQELEKYRASLPGGGGGVFRKRIPQAR